MPVITKYVCDKCGYTQENDQQMWNVAVAVDYYPRNPGNSYSAKSALWCRACVEKIGMLPTENAELRKSIKDNPPTIEDMIREIVQGEIQNQ